MYRNCGSKYSMLIVANINIFFSSRLFYFHGIVLCNYNFVVLEIYQSLTPRLFIPC